MGPSKQNKVLHLRQRQAVSHPQSIKLKEIIIKKLQNRRDKNKKSKARQLFNLYGKELRQRINNDQKLAKDIEEFRKIYEEQKYFMRT